MKNTFSFISITLLSLVLTSQPAWSEEPTYQSDYVGQEKREIKTLSPDDISQLREGRGWGLAKAAELNGLPGPIHLLEMQEEIELSSEQIEKITHIYEKMKTDAQRLGNRLIALEKSLNSEFVNKTITDKRLKQLLTAIAETRKVLRYTHLSAHLSTPALLSEKQLTAYNSLRGYNSGDPCNNIPKGHDPKMWRMHNGCS